MSKNRKLINGIITVDNPKHEKILHKAGRRLKNAEFQNTENLLMMQVMATLCAQDNVLGIAAPQLGQSVRVFAIAEKLLAPMNKKYNCTFFFNPRIIQASEETYVDTEACLSVPGKVAVHRRHKWVRMHWQDEKGETFEWTFEGLLGKAMEHETGHCNGVLCIDHAEKVMTDAEMQQIFTEAKDNETAATEEASAE